MENLKVLHLYLWRWNKIPDFRVEIIPLCSVFLGQGKKPLEREIFFHFFAVNHAMNPVERRIKQEVYNVWIENHVADRNKADTHTGGDGFDDGRSVACIQDNAWSCVRGAEISVS